MGKAPGYPILPEVPGPAEGMADDLCSLEGGIPWTCTVPRLSILLSVAERPKEMNEQHKELDEGNATP